MLEPRPYFFLCPMTSIRGGGNVLYTPELRDIVLWHARILGKFLEICSPNKTTSVFSLTNILPLFTQKETWYIYNFVTYAIFLCMQHRWGRSKSVRRVSILFIYIASTRLFIYITFFDHYIGASRCVQCDFFHGNGW